MPVASIMPNGRPKLVISAGALGLLAAHLLWPGVKVDQVALGLAALALLPWLSSIIDSAKLPGGWELKFREVQVEQVKQRQDLDAILKFLVQNFVTDDEMVHLEKLNSGSVFTFRRSDSFEKELRRLLSLRLIDRLPDRGIRSLFEAGDDVSKHLKISERGRDYLRQRSMFAVAGEEKR